jgi:Zn finger protein HypA/HybF involved in hydrogenase expression
MIKCLNCSSGLKGNAIPVKCPICGNKDLTKYIRVDGNIDSVKHELEMARMLAKRGE